MISNFFNDLLRTVDSRIVPDRTIKKFQLDKNEQSYDVNPVLKRKVLESLMAANWNRYPASDYKDIESKIAGYCHVDPESVVLSAGSASIITTLLDFFALNNKKITITQPSYSLFDYHCKTYNINYNNWFLNSNLEFDYLNMPELDRNSVLIITSPNNPVGNSIDKDKLEYLLQKYPDSFIILDAVYTEFSEHDFTTLINHYDNLLVLRSFSKAFPIAGLRLGYLCAAPETAAIIKKLILQFSITYFSLIFAKELLFDKEFMEAARKRVRHIIRARNEVSAQIMQEFGNDSLQVYPSEGNFILIRVNPVYRFDELMDNLKNHGIKVLNTSNFPMLNHTFRISIGNSHENHAFLQCLRSSLKSLR